MPHRYERHLTPPRPNMVLPAKGSISLDLFVVVVFLQLERVHSDVVALRLSELFAFSEFLGLVFDDLLLDLL
jgi:hypothetical protein